MSNTETERSQKLIKDTKSHYRNLPKVGLSDPVLRKLEANLPEGISLTKYVNQLLMEI